MPNLYTIETKNEVGNDALVPGEKASVLYHNLFDFPMNFADLVKWKVGMGYEIDLAETEVISKNGYYFISGKEASVYKRILRKRISEQKIEIAKKAANLLTFVPGIKMVGITGSLAMKNSAEDGDIDFIIITKKGTLWTSRLFAYSLIRLFGFKARKAGSKEQKDMLCLNMWLDESDLVWRDRNLYSAHEIAQIVPLVNKGKTYDRLLMKNRWILNFWPNAVKLNNELRTMKNAKKAYSIVHKASFISFLFEKMAYKLQYRHMKSKITREVVTPTRALFHPQNWGKVVLGRLSS